MAPTVDDVKKVLRLISSRDELEYFYDHLESPEWIPAIRDARLFESPPAPVEEGDGVWFPAWGLSRYLVRMADRAPDLVAECLNEVSTAVNPRVRMDVVDALLVLPTSYAVPFVGRMTAWMHDPYRLGINRDIGRLLERMIGDGIQEGALELLRSFAMLVPPDDQAGSGWLPIESYEYGEYLPRLGALAGAAFGLAAISALGDELDRALRAEYGATDPESERRDLSFIWRPAIENHEQNEDFEPKAKLLVALRDALDSAVDAGPVRMESAVEELRRRAWPVFSRLALYLIDRFGDESPEVVASALTDENFFRNTDVHHEYYRLASRRFGELSDEAKGRYLALVERVPDEVTAEDEPEIAERRRRWWRRNRLGAVADSLADPWREEYVRLAADFGTEEHPDFLSYHTSWMGPTSPLSAEDVVRLGPDALIDYLVEWRPEGAEMRPSPEGLARTITEAVKSDPGAFAPTAPRYAALEPAYARGLLFGLREAIRTGATFEWPPVLALAAAIIQQPISGDETAVDRGRDPGWAWCRTEIGHLIEAGLDPGTGEIPLEERARVWSVIRVLVEDADPTPESEARFGSPNMDPVTHSINTTRGVALNAALAYGWWIRRHQGQTDGWRLSVAAPELVEVIDRHLDPVHDPSLSIRAVYGWWLPWLIAMDGSWVRANLNRLLGDLSTPRELTAWEAYVVHGQADSESYGVLADQYSRYAALLVELDEQPSQRIASVLPFERYIDHLVRLRNRLPVDETSPFRVLLSRGSSWLVAAVVRNTGRLLHAASELDPDVSDSFRLLWVMIRDTVASREEPEVRAALAPFGWWFASPLPPEWTLPELLWTLEQAGATDPGFLVLERLADVADSKPALALEVLDKIVAQSEHGWELRAKEEKLGRILVPALSSDDPTVRMRAEVLTNRLGRLGLHGLRTLVM
jgi:hypothetical protein